MFDYIKGIYTFKTASDKGYYATVEVHGIGYRLEIMERDYNILPSEGEELKLHSVLIHREDKMSLCGFIKREDRDIFNILTSVSGVGSKMALTLLNSFKVSNLISFVIEGNHKELTKAKGVGPKLAQKIILELKDKLNSFTENSKITTVSKTSSVPDNSNENANDAKNVLFSLGYDKNEVFTSVENALKTLPENASAEDILKKSLQLLSV